uniref:Sulfotransferase domain-containing protein n=1 Tax=Coccolithus braarudii TaxID=221442 RepID=A0A7S0L6Z7_9EUKA|mmetsp:Transcript_23681/g.51052  ORF Transcript_23681/g.51052 Transcript_23681/m.51052 type:complete len:376 (+) Transcript_23681:215-1342(+)
MQMQLAGVAVNVSTVESSVAHFLALVSAAARLAPTPLYSASRPLISFAVPKSGSNTQLAAHLCTLSMAGERSHAGCLPPPKECRAGRAAAGDAGDRTSCLANPRVGASCSVAFFIPRGPSEIIRALAMAKADPSSHMCTWSHVNLKMGAVHGSTDDYQRALRQSVCTIVLRDPVARYVSAHYEWRFKSANAKITTNLSAPDYLRAYGPEKFINAGMKRRAPNQRAYFEGAGPALFDSCIIGVTEAMDDFLQTLGRVVRIPSSMIGTRRRSRPKVGMDETDWPELYARLTPLIEDEIALWRIATNIAARQHEAAVAWPTVISRGGLPHHSDDEVCNCANTHGTSQVTKVEKQCIIDGHIASYPFVRWWERSKACAD